MDKDDDPVGTILGRRRLLCYMGGAGIGLMALRHGLVEAHSTVACVVSPESIEGPYYLDQRLERSDLRIDPSNNKPVDGLPLDLALNISQVHGNVCRPLPGAIVDIWQCDAMGEYSGVDDRIIGFNTLGKGYLRGYQRADASGQVRFQSIYPGWYHARCVHIHVKVRTSTPQFPNYEFTSQIYLDEAITDKVHAMQPYARKPRRDWMQDQDMFFTKRGGKQMMLALQPMSGGGFQGTLNIGLDLSDAKAARSDSWKLDPLNPVNHHGPLPPKPPG